MGRETKAVRIFVIEDSNDFRELLREVLELKGYHVEEATNGKEALDKLSAMNDLPNLILLDIMMPVMDGNAYHKKHSTDQRLSKIPIVMMSAHSDFRVDEVHAGVKGKIKKPLTMDALYKVIETALQAS